MADSGKSICTVTDYSKSICTVGNPSKPSRTVADSGKPSRTVTKVGKLICTETKAIKPQLRDGRRGGGPSARPLSMALCGFDVSLGSGRGADCPQGQFLHPFRVPGPPLGSGPVVHVIERVEITYIGLLKVKRQLGIYGMKSIDCTVSKIHIVQSIDKILYYAS